MDLICDDILLNILFFTTNLDVESNFQWIRTCKRFYYIFLSKTFQKKLTDFDNFLLKDNNFEIINFGKKINYYVSTQNIYALKKILGKFTSLCDNDEIAAKDNFFKFYCTELNLYDENIISNLFDYLDGKNISVKCFFIIIKILISVQKLNIKHSYSYDSYVSYQIGSFYEKICKKIDKIFCKLDLNQLKLIRENMPILPRSNIYESKIITNFDILELPTIILLVPQHFFDYILKLSLSAKDLNFINKLEKENHWQCNIYDNFKNYVLTLVSSQIHFFPNLLEEYSNDTNLYHNIVDTIKNLAEHLSKHNLNFDDFIIRTMRILVKIYSTHFNFFSYNEIVDIFPKTYKITFSLELLETIIVKLESRTYYYYLFEECDEILKKSLADPTIQELDHEIVLLQLEKITNLLEIESGKDCYLYKKRIGIYKKKYDMLKLFIV